MPDFLGGDQRDGELLQGDLSPADEYAQQQVTSWKWIALCFAILLPWAWLYSAFAYDTGKLLAVIATIVMHAGLALVWVGRRRGDRRL